MQYKSYPANIKPGEPFFLFTPIKASYTTGGQNTKKSYTTIESGVGPGGMESTVVEKEESIQRNVANENSIALHIPRGIAFSDSMKYSNIESGILVTALEKLRRVAGEGGGGLGDVNDAQVTAFLARSGVGGEFLSNLRRNNLQKNQQIVSPREFVLFDSPSLRTFNMTFKFLPETKQESENVKEIIKTFRRNMYPTFADKANIIYQFPLAFRIDIEGIKEGHMIKFPEVVLKDAGVTYNANSMSYFDDGGDNIPIEVDLSLTFSELLPQSQLDIDAGF